MLEGSAFSLFYYLIFPCSIDGLFGWKVQMLKQLLAQGGKMAIQAQNDFLEVVDPSVKGDHGERCQDSSRETDAQWSV